MHPYLIKLGVDPVVQDFFMPYYRNDTSGNLLFDYGDEQEVYGLAWHRVPSTENLWFAGNSDLTMVMQVIICSSAMEAIAWFNYHHTMSRNWDQLCFVATGCSLSDVKLALLHKMFAGKLFVLLCSNDLLGKICDLRIAAALRSHPVTVAVHDDRVEVVFRAACYTIDAEQFSVNNFEKLSAFRFNVHTLKPKGASTWLDRLTAAAL